MKNTNESIFAMRLKLALSDLGWSQSELARQLHVTPQAVQRWCNGISEPRRNAIQNLAKVTGKPESWFFSGSVPVEQSIAHSSDHYQTQPELKQKYDLTKEELQLIELYRDLPGEERRRMLELFQVRLDEINEYVKQHLSSVIIKNR